MWYTVHNYNEYGDKSMKHVDIYTDGACRGNPGKGGWGAILVYGNTEKELSGGERETTNNRMELTAVISALSALKERCEVTLTSDSKYVIDAVTKGWAVAWKAKGWRKADKSPALNVDLWEQLLALLDQHEVSFVWVRGHNGHPYNERCDALATAFADSFTD
jgi:ribonuclease HI